MTSASQSLYTEVQIAAWLQGLFTVAWADGNFDPEEKEVVQQLINEELASGSNLPSLDQQISPEELVTGLGKDPQIAENFIRTAVMVALADGIYSITEANVLHKFCEALGLKVAALDALRTTLCQHEAIKASDTTEKLARKSVTLPHPPPDVLQPMREWLDGMEVHDPRVARFICKMIPSQCPFERDVTLFGHKIVRIPPMCKINPLYEQLVGLRFRALSYLADDRGEDISKYL